MQIKEAKLDDVTEIVELWSEFIIEHEKYLSENNPLLKEFETMDENFNEIYKKYIAPYLESESGTVFYAEENGEMIGFVFIIIKEDIPLFERKEIGFISDLYVKKSYRNQKISTMLIEKSYEWFKSKGIDLVSLTTYFDNKQSRAVYKKFDFMDYKMELRKKI